MNDPTAERQRSFGEGPFDAFLNTTLSVAPSNLAQLHLFDNNTATNQFYKENRRLAYNENSPAEIEHYIVTRLKPTLALCRVQTKCMSCGAMYQPLNNIGGWQCRWHPGYMQSNDLYSCCNTRGPGCKRCDHSPQMRVFKRRWPNRSRAIRVPRYLHRVIRWNPESVDGVYNDEQNPAHSYCAVLRAEVDRNPPVSHRPISVI